MKKLNEAEDRRVRKTKKLLEDSLAELLIQKPLNSITVRELAERADINRGTFYLHYKDVYDMVDKIQNDIFTRFNEIVKDYKPKYGEQALEPYLVELYKLLADNSKLARCLIGKNGDAAFVDRIRKSMKEKCFEDVFNVLKLKNSDEYEYFYCFVEMGVIGMCAEWLESGMKESPEKMAEMTENLIQKSISVLR